MIFRETDRIMSAMIDVSICIFYIFRRASLVAQVVKNLPTWWETRVQSLGWKTPWRRERLPTPVFWRGEFHGERSLAGYGPCGCRESDITEWLSLFHLYFGALCRPMATNSLHVWLNQYLWCRSSFSLLDVSMWTTHNKSTRSPTSCLSYLLFWDPISACSIVACSLTWCLFSLPAPISSGLPSAVSSLKNNSVHP